MLARDILAIQAAGVGIEREFNHAGGFIQDNRAYGSETLSALMIGHHYLGEINYASKRDYYLSAARLEEIDAEEMEAEIEEDKRQMQEILTGLIQVEISDDEEEGEDTEQIIELRNRFVARSQRTGRVPPEPRVVRNTTGSRAARGRRRGAGAGGARR